MGKKFKWILGLIAGLSLLLAGCGNSTEEGNGSGNEESTDKKVGIILTQAGLGGESFNDLAYNGVQDAAEDFGIEYDYVEPDSTSDYRIIQEEMASSGEYEVIIVVGFEQVDALESIAPNYPEQNFALIDAIIDLPNIASYVSKEEEGSFLVGALSALVKNNNDIDMVGNDKVLGFIGGVESPLMEKFAAGYIAGAQYIDSEYNVLIDYAGSFSDPSTAKVISETMNSQGADIQYHAAGASGMGMFQASVANDFISIGVNTNQNGVEPDHIMTSMLKLVNEASYDVIQKAINNEFTAGTTTLGLADGGIDYTFENSNIEVSEELVGIVEELKQDIIDGNLEIPNTLGNVDEFLENNSYTN